MELKFFRKVYIGVMKYLLSDKKQKGAVKMSDSIRITIRLSRAAAEKLEELVKSGEYKNLSDVVRTAIENFLAEKFAPKNVEKISVDLPKSTVAMLVKLVEAGDAVDLDDAIRTAVREYVRKQISELARESIEREIKKELVKEES